MNGGWWSCRCEERRSRSHGHRRWSWDGLSRFVACRGDDSREERTFRDGMESNAACSVDVVGGCVRGGVCALRHVRRFSATVHWSGMFGRCGDDGCAGWGDAWDDDVGRRADGSGTERAWAVRGAADRCDGACDTGARAEVDTERRLGESGDAADEPERALNKALA